MELILKKGLVLKFKKYNFNVHFGVFWSNFIKIVFFFLSI